MDRQMSCQYAHEDGSYVLGALSRPERKDFEGHLTRCNECAQSVRDLAAMPRLLARLDTRSLQAFGLNNDLSQGR